MEKVLKVLEPCIGRVPDFFTPTWFDQSTEQICRAIARDVCPAEDAFRFIMQAGRCSQWMRAAGVEYARFVGPFRRNPFQCSSVVIIPLGAKVLCGRSQVPVRREHKVVLSGTSEGYTDIVDGKFVARNPSILWSSGHYVHVLDLCLNPALIPAQEQPAVAAIAI